MKAELEKLIRAERKYKRQLSELRAARKRQSELREPDQRVVKMIDEEIAALLQSK